MLFEAIALLLVYSSKMSISLSDDKIPLSDKTISKFYVKLSDGIKRASGEL